MTSFDVDWDIEKYKFEHETEEHWELRKSFLSAHKEKFPEDELVCLAQVFSNVELLGCKYPKETMELIEELSRDVAEDFRTKQKSKLQRTFVKASEAASSKVKGLHKTPQKRSNSEAETTPTENDEEAENSLRKKTKLEIFGSAPYGSIILIDYPNDGIQNIIQRAAGAAHVTLDWKFDLSTNCECSLFMNNKFLAKGSAVSQKDARNAAAAAALDELKKYYYTIKVKKAFNTEVNTTLSSNELRQEAIADDSLKDDNIGKKLMKLMGWTGGGLGKAEQGIVEPVQVQKQISRQGIGLKPKNQDEKNCKQELQALQAKCREMIKEFLMGDMETDLVFSTDFTNEERSAMHQVARQMGIKSHSHGPKNRRTLIFSRKINSGDLVMELKALGGHTDKYELIEPLQ